MSLATDTCQQCGINPRPKGCRRCAACVHANMLASRAHFLKLAEAKRSAARAEKWKDAVCRCGCGVHVMPPNKYAPGCKESHHAAIREADALRTKEQRVSVKPPAPVKLPPKVKRVLMTDAEQARINAEVDRARLIRCGMLTMDQGRSLSPAEIAALVDQGKVTPLHLIPHKDLPGYNPWSGYKGGVCA